MIMICHLRRWNNIQQEEKATHIKKITNIQNKKVSKELKSKMFIWSLRN